MNIDISANNPYFCDAEEGTCSLFLILYDLENLEAKIKSLLELRFQEEKFKNCFLVEINQSKKKLQVFIDSDDGIDYKSCVRFSRYLEEYLDESQVLGIDYTLDVSSPGAEKPIVKLRQLPKHIGRKFKINTKEEPDITIEGKLVKLEGNILEIEIKEKRKDAYITIFNFEDIQKLKIVLSF